MVPLKTQFFEEIARDLNAFLLIFSMVIFLVETLDQLRWSFCSKFITKDILSKTSTLALSKVNLSDSNNHLPISKVDIGFGLKQQLKELRSSDKINDRQEYQFKSEALKFVVA